MQQTLLRQVINENISSFDTALVSSQDITVCICVRLYEFNPWVLDRLVFQLGFYNPAPKFKILDFGSEEYYADKIQHVCSSYENVEYLYVNDKEEFSLSSARNIVGRSVNTDFIFFSDIDFVYSNDIFHTLAKYASELNIKNYVKRPLYFPIYHINRLHTEFFEGLPTNKEKNNYLTEIGFMGQNTAFGDIFDFVAPYSNAFLIHKSFFDLSGGYCDLFRGHGSEDFEYFIRLGLLSTDFILPSMLNKDFYGPLKDTFFTKADYLGFRRYSELLAKTSESLGLKAFHLWHDKPKDKGYWTKSNDWKRERFNSIIDEYYPDIHKVLDADYHPRSQTALCLISDVSSWGYFLPLRAYGYKLYVNSSKDEFAIYNIINQLEQNKFDRVFIFNPYMKSNSHFRGVIEVAKSLNIEVTVIERGGLPNSIYYAREVAYGDSDYKNLESILKDYKMESPERTKTILSSLKSGEFFLEKQESYELTWRKYGITRLLENKIIFIPLQLSDDMAVTKFNEGYMKYEQFMRELYEVASRYTNIVFLIKKHPLSKTELDDLTHLENVVVAGERDNIHALIDISTACITYNSGVGLLSVLHGNLTFNIGNSYYTTADNLSNQVYSITEAIDKIQIEDYHVSSENYILNYLDWMIHYKYSWFQATSQIREFEDRKSHGYKDISVEQIVLDGKSKKLASMRDIYKFNKKSYLGWQARLSVIEEKKHNEWTKKVNSKTNHNSSMVVEQHSNIKNGKNDIKKANSKPRAIRLVKKLKNDPKRFFNDSKNPIAKLISKKIFN